MTSHVFSLILGKNFNENKKKIKILDLTADQGVSWYLKSALFNGIDKNEYNISVIQIVPVSIKFYFSNLFFFKIIKDFPLFFSEFLLSVRIVFPLIFYKSRDRDDFVSKCIKLKYRGLLVGDCIVSAFFRSARTPDLPEKSFYTVFFILISIINIGFQIRQISNYSDHLNHKNATFFNFETTGWPEVWRRYLISKNIPELRYSIYHQSYRLFGKYNGVELRKGIVFRKYIYDSISSKELILGRKTIEGLVARKQKYIYLQSIDIDNSKRIEITPFPRKSTVVLFLSTISDAQYSYGVGPYADLPSFQESILDRSLKAGYNVVVKPHPNMFKDKDYTVKDRRYYNSLKRKWRASVFKEGLERSNSDPCLFFADSKISTIELKRVFPDFFCITQHGTAAVECAFNQIFCLVASNSKYSVNDKFLRIFKNKSEFDSFLEEWQKFAGYSIDEMDSLYKFSYLNNIKCKPQHANQIFGAFMPLGLDSWKAEKWLADFSKEQVNRDKLDDRCKKYIEHVGSDLSKVITWGIDEF